MYLSLKVFSYFLYLFSFITVMVSQIMYYVLVYYDIPEDAREIHYENTPIQIYRKFHVQKLKIFR